MLFNEYELAVDPKVAALGISLVAFTASGLSNRRPSDALNAGLPDIEAIGRRLKSSYGNHRNEALEGFKILRERCRRSWKRYPPSCLSLSELYEIKGRVPSISPIVDLYNAFSLASGLSLGAHDVRALTGNVSLSFSEGGEEFRPLGSIKTQILPASEYVYRDDNAILCRMEARQANHSAIKADTTDALFIVQGHDLMPAEYIQGVASELIDGLSLMHPKTDSIII